MFGEDSYPTPRKRGCMKHRRRIRLYLNRKYRSFRKHLRVREWRVSLTAQRQERRLVRSWSGLRD